MNSGAQQQQADGVAEEILRTIYGDDLAGCPVRLDAISSIVFAAVKGAGEDQEQLLQLYEKAVEAFALLSTPPALEQTPTPEQLRALLGERLDQIHLLAQRLIKTAAAIKAQGSTEPPEEGGD